MWNDRWDTFERFDFWSYTPDTATAIGNSGFGLAHGPGHLIKPELPLSTTDLLGVDLTHVIHTSDVAYAKGSNGGGGGGKPGGGGGSTFDAINYTSGSADGSGFNITIEFKGTWTESLYNTFITAADQLTELITGDVADVTVFGLKGGPRLVDDIVITAELKAIDGEGGILGQAGPTSIRTANYLPATAIMQFDSADAATFEGLKLFDDIVFHEMSHSLGFGSIWDYKGLVDNGQYVGAHAVAEYGGLIPVETDGGSGTAGSHWDEDTFGNELMTGYINLGGNVFSDMSAAAFADLGYTIDNSYGSFAWVNTTYEFG